MSQRPYKKPTRRRAPVRQRSVAPDAEPARIERAEAPALEAEGDEAIERKPSVAKSTMTMSLATLLSRLTGFVRTWAMAFALGNTIFTSSYQIANNLPTELFDLVAGGVMSAAFLPVYLAVRNREGKERGNEYASTLITLSLIILAIASVLAIVFAPQLIWTQTFLAHDQIDTSLAVWFFRFFAIQLLLYMVGAITEALLNAHREFLWPALGPVFNNLVVIVTMFGYVPISHASPEAAKVWLAVGTTLGVAAMVFIQVPAMLRCGIKIRPHINIHDPALKEMLRLALPAVLFTAVNFVGASVQNAFAMSVADNGTSTLAYARMWYLFPYGVLSVALTTAMFTEMADNISKGKWGAFKGNITKGLSLTFVLIIPMAAMLISCAAPIITLYRAGAFTAADVAQVTTILQFWAVALPFYSAYMYLYRAFSSLRDLMTVVVVDVVCRVIQIVAWAVLVRGVGPWQGLGLPGIPIANTIFYVVMFFILLSILKRRVRQRGAGDVRLAAVAVVAVKTAVASAVGAAVVFALLSFVGTGAGVLTALLRVVACGIIGLVVTYLLCALLRVREVRQVAGLFGRVARKFKRA